MATAVGALGGAAAGIPGFGTRVVVGAGIGVVADLTGQLIANPNLGAVNWGSVAGAALGGGLASYGARVTVRHGEILLADRWTREWAAALIGVGPSAGLPLVGGAFWNTLRATRPTGSTAYSSAAPGTGESLGSSAPLK